jgi:hypothetical protein
MSDDPIACAFCVDDEGDPVESPNPSVGQMLLVFQGTQTEIPGPPEERAPSFLRACSDCGPLFTDHAFGTSPEGKVGVFQFEHDDYSKVTEEQHASLVAQFETNVCSLCDEVLWPEGNQQEMPTQTLVTKMLRQAPGGITLSHVCGRCTELGLCPDCGPDHDH